MGNALSGEAVSVATAETPAAGPHPPLGLSLRHTLGPSSALRVFVPDAVGRLRTAASEGSWPEEADALTVTRRRPAFEQCSEIEIALLSPAGMVLLLLPLVDEGEPIGIVEIVAPKTAVAEQRDRLPELVAAITTRCRGSVEAPRSNGSKRKGDASREHVAHAHGNGSTNGQALDASATLEFHGVRVLLADKHKLFAEAIRNVLEDMGAEVLPPVYEATEALASAGKSCPDLILVDLSIGPTDAAGPKLGQDLLQECPGAKVIALSSAADPRGGSESIRAGFHGCVTKDVPLGQFVGAVRAALHGEIVQSNGHGGCSRESHTPEKKHADMLSDHLTPREREVLALLVEGTSGTGMARRLSASPNTIRTHIQSILTKLQVHSRLEAATFAVRHGLVRIPGERGQFPARASHAFAVDGIRHRSGEEAAPRP